MPWAVEGCLNLLMYISGLEDLILSHELSLYFYADGCQLFHHEYTQVTANYSFLQTRWSGQCQCAVVNCINNVSDWLSFNRLKWNPLKLSSFGQPQVDGNISLIVVLSLSLQPILNHLLCKPVGVLLDLSFKSQVNILWALNSNQLRQIKFICTVPSYRCSEEFVQHLLFHD